MPLSLTDLPLVGQRAELHALIEAGADVGSGTSDIFLLPPRGTRGEVVDGNITLTTTEISRVRIVDGSRLILYDSNNPDFLSLSTYFGLGGDGRDLTLYFVTTLGMFSIPIDDNGSNGYSGIGGSSIAFNLSTDTVDSGDGFGFDDAGLGFDQRRFLPSPYNARDIVQGIDSEDRFILAFARPAVLSIEASSTAPAPSSTAAVQTRTPTHHAVTVAASFGASTTTVAVAKRQPVRKQVEAGITFAVYSPDVTVGHRQRHVVEASRSFNGIASTTTVAVRAPTHRTVTAVATFGALTTTVTVGKLEPRLQLSDFQVGTFRVDALALITRQSTGTVLWNRAGSRFGGTETLDDGEFNFGDPDTPITRLQHTSTTQIRLNDDGGVNLRTYFDTGGDGFDSTIWIQTVDGVSSFPAQGNIAAGGGNWIRFLIPADFNTLLDDIQVTDHFIFAITRPALRYDIEASRFFNAPTGTASVTKRLANRHTVTADETFGMATSTTAVDTRTPNRREVQADGLFEPVDVYTAQVLRRLAVRREVTATVALPQPFGMATVTVREPTRRTVTAAATFGALASTVSIRQTHSVLASRTFGVTTQTAAVLTRTTQRRSVTASRGFGAITSTTAVAKRLSTRREVRASVLYADVKFLTDVRRRIRVVANTTFGAFGGTATVDQRIATRNQVEADATYGASTGTVTVQRLTRDRREVQASALRSPAIFTTAVTLREPTRRTVQADTTYGAVTSTVAVDQRIANRLEVQADTTFGAVASTAAVIFKYALFADTAYDGLSGTVSIGSRQPVRRMVEASGSFVGVTGSTAVNKRLSARLTVEASATFGAATFTASVRRRVSVTASHTFGVPTATATVGVRSITRHEVRANSQHSVAVYSAPVGKRGIVRYEVQASHTYGIPAFTAAVTKRFASRKVVEVDTTFAAFAPTVAVMIRTTMQKAVEASRSFGAAIATVTVGKTVTVRHEVVATSEHYPFPTYVVSAVGKREAQDKEVQADVTYTPADLTVLIGHITAPMKAIEASTTYVTAISDVAVMKGAAMPPDMVTGLMLVIQGYNFLELVWIQPGLGTGVLTNYEYRIGTGAWVSTMNAQPMYTITGLMSDTEYSITIRAQTNVGRGPASQPLVVRTLATSPPEVVQFLTARPSGANSVDLSWFAPSSDGGAAITGYETAVVENGVQGAFESHGHTRTSHRVRGLRTGIRYGFVLRARNTVGPGTLSATVYATPTAPAVVTVPSGDQIPLLNADRQSVIVRLGELDCRVRVYWQPSDESWHGALEVPVNTQVTRGQRLTVDNGLLPAGSAVLPGNVVLRAIDEDSAFREPMRDAWLRSTHGLYWESNA